ncbi:hypothetical protein SFHH103_psfHH103d_523 (plasmid) [Sinorhizobium fredii HH103]|nr:hypothetical protein SFHH103_04570 [Sinorhizobium fredii HH103]CEO91730.1 hypothetical protein SFHH103_psfHH103d_523 [Sinorhizobium fredii HH103]
MTFLFEECFKSRDVVAQDKGVHGNPIEALFRSWSY